MIEQKDVVTMKIPFPTIADDLAVFPHMYICLENDGGKKRFLKCQTLKPRHLGKNKEPYYRVVEDANLSRNPFEKMTLIDCDKTFSIEAVRISTGLLAKNRKDICQDLFNSVMRVSNHSQLKEHLLDREFLLKLNYKIKAVN